MDPLGAAASVITIVQTAWVLSVQVKKLIVKIKSQDEDVQQLEDKADTLGAIIKEVENTYGLQEEQGSTLPGESGHDNIRTLVDDAISRCKDDLEEFEAELSKLLDKRHTIAGSVLRKWRQQTAAPTFARIAKSIESHQLSLQLLIQILHGRNLKSTRQVMAEGFVAVLASNRKMFAMLQGLAGPQQGVARQDTEATLVPQPDDNEAEGQTVFSDENDPALHEFFERIFAVWLKNNVADSGSPVLTKQSTSPGSSLNSSTSTTDPSKWAAGSFGGYAMGQGRPRRPSSPSIDPTETDSANALHPMKSSSSLQSRTSSVSAASSTSMMTPSTSLFASSQASDLSRVAGRKSRSSETRRSNDRSGSFADTHIKLDLGGSDPQARRKGMELLGCIQENHIPTIERLIENGATLEEGDGTKKTPLLLAASLGKVDAVNILLRKGADPSARDSTDQTALHLAIRRPSAHTVIPFLLEPPNPQQLDSISELHNNLVNARDKDGRTPLHDCVRFGMLKSAETLIAHNADINARDSKGLPPAYHAMKNRKYEIVELLVEKKADFGDFEWPPPHDISREIGNLLKENGWKRPLETAKEDLGSGGKSKRPENSRSSRSWPKVRDASLKGQLLGARF